MLTNGKQKSVELNFYQVLIYRLLFSLLLFWLSRLLFYLFNTNYFSHLDFSELIKILVFGLRFDLSAIFMLNAPYVLMMTIPLPLRRSKAWQAVALFFYYLGNTLGLTANFIDIIYFRFTQKRMTGDIFDFAGNDIGLAELLPQFIKDYWPYILLLILLIGTLIFLSQRIKHHPRKKQLGKYTNLAYQVFAFILTMGILLVGIRGGLQLKPINIITAGKVSDVRNSVIVLNTPFTIVKTINMQVLEKKHYFSDEECEQIFSPLFMPLINNNQNGFSLEGRNVVMIIMESLSSEHTGAFNRDREGYDGFTPFLDSLIDHAIVFEGFANGKQSIEGIPSLVASLPSLMDRPYINSAYAGDKINSLANLLSKKNYNTSFYHGGTNGTMDFDGFAKVAGFENYYGRTEYNNEDDYDGNWGIFDEPFFGYYAQNLSHTPQPFFSTIFSLSAHHPYTIPEEHTGKFKDGNLEIQKTVMYSDYALGEFFKRIKTEEWYENTIFIISADHTSEAYLDDYKTRVGMYRIPIIFYTPGIELEQPQGKTASQADVMPTVLRMLNYEHPFVAFGEDLFHASKTSFAVNYLGGMYQLISGNFVIEYDGRESRALYNFEKDPLLKNNILPDNPRKGKEMEKMLKAYLQQYNNRVIENRLVVVP